MLGLRIDGRLVVSPVMQNARATCQESLGLTLKDRAVDGTGSRIWWLRGNFRHGPPPDATEDVVRNFASAYILWLLSSVLFVDKLGIRCVFS